MKKFNKTPPTKKISASYLAITGDEELPIKHVVQIVGVERMPLIVHRAFNDVENVEVIRGTWQITHLFTGFSLGIFGSYDYCRMVANELLEEPILYLPSEKMMWGHPDYNGLSKRVSAIMQNHWHLGGMEEKRSIDK